MSFEAASTDEAASILQLSARQRQCLEQVAAGRTSKAIARALGLSRRTVDHYISLLCAKLGVKTRAQAVAVAMALGILGPRAFGEGADLAARGASVFRA